MDSWCKSQTQALEQLEREAPGVPFLALGQTVFWDEPMKGVVIQAAREAGFSRPFVAGIHDTDYFAKLHLPSKKAGYKALPHNDTTTKDLWSAAAEFSSLFGSETVVTKEALQTAGAKLARIERERPGWLDEVTEAYGWRGIASYGHDLKIIAEKPLQPLFGELYDTFEWAVDESISLISGNHLRQSQEMAQKLKALVCDLGDDRTVNLGTYYQRLLPHFYDQVAGEPLGVVPTTTTTLLAFNPETASLPRFKILGFFLDPRTRAAAEDAYNAAVHGTEMYTLDRFGTGALPFEVVVPGMGRGTLKLGTRGGVIACPEPVGFSFKKAPETTAELAEILEKRFGPGLTLVGKAVSLIGMLATEHVFVFHEGASSYMPRTVKFHNGLRRAGLDIQLHPILRVHHRPWDAMQECCAWLKLPEPLRRPFGTDELSAPSFASRWREVAQSQQDLLQELGKLRRPLDLVQFLQREVGGHWNCLANEYVAIHEQFMELRDRISVIRSQKKGILARIKELKAKVEASEHARGVHWRDRVFEKEATPQDLEHRESLIANSKRLREEIHIAWDQWRGLQSDQDHLVSTPDVERAQARRADIALEAELMRTRLIRSAIVASNGLEKAGRRPSAWWFPLVCPDGSWRRANARRATFRVEALVTEGSSGQIRAGDKAIPLV